MSRAERLNQDDYFHAAVIYAGATYHLVAERDPEQDEEDDEEEGADAKPLYAYIVSVFHEATGTTRREVCFSGEYRGVNALDWLIEQSQENGVFADIARVVDASVEEALAQLLDRLDEHGSIDPIREEGPIEDARTALQLRKG